MATDTQTNAALALHRFGYGPRAGSIAAIASDPRGALLAELAGKDTLRIANGLPTSAQAARAAFEFRAERRAAQMAAQRETERKRAMAEEAGQPVMEAKSDTPEGT